MPSTYAHYRMGKEVMEQVPQKERSIMEENLDLYMIGLHGPDILFYYGALWNNPVNAVGFGLHNQSGRSFFETACEAIKKSGNRQAALAYAYGVLNHFALDTTCHRYVDEQIERSGLTHTEIEVGFDSSLMRLDGYDPVGHVLTDHIHPTEGNAEIISGFYSGVTAKQVKKSLRSMIFYNKLLLARTPFQRNAIYAILKATGNYKEMHGLIVTPEENPACEESNERLLELYEQAKRSAVTWICGFDGNLSGAVPFDARFDYDFSGRKKGGVCL